MMNIEQPLKPMDRILIYKPSPFGRMYLCADGTLSGNRADAQEHYAMQFADVVRENWIVNMAAGGATIEVVR